MLLPWPACLPGSTQPGDYSGAGMQDHARLNLLISNHRISSTCSGKKPDCCDQCVISHSKYAAYRWQGLLSEVNSGSQTPMAYPCT